MIMQYPKRVCEICGYIHIIVNDGFDWMDCQNHRIKMKWALILKLAEILKKLD